MKIIYNTCYADPWLQVAKKLQKEHNFEPIYWNGYEDDNSETLVKKEFPKIIYQKYYDSWKGIFPPEINTNYDATHVNIDFLRSNAVYELQTLLMMNRMDDTRYNFNLLERRRLFLQFVKSWSAVINQLNPDMVISAIVPHRVYDYVLYLLCKHHNIKYITFRESAFEGFAMPLTKISGIGDFIKEKYKENLQNKNTNSLYENLDNTIKTVYEKVKKDYSVAEPDYMRQHIVSHKKSASTLSLARKVLRDMSIYKDKYFGSNGYLRKGIPTYTKTRNKSIENSNLSLYQYSVRKRLTTKYKNKLKKHYQTLTDEIDITVPYVSLALHYQPEMTSNPSGDIFTDQLLCVEILSKYLPKNYLIYVKEHRSQFYAHTEGHSYRIKEFYDDLKKYSQVRLVPLDFDIFTLIKNSKAISTVTGTAGWEGIVLGKPVIIFGLAWYEKYEGVLKITNEESASQIPIFIKDFKFSHHNLISYLSAFNENGVKAYYYRGLKEQMNQDEEECISNLTNSILQLQLND